jgi:hypothetical protein
MRTVALFAVLVLAPSTDAIAQAQPLLPGQRVRVTAPTLGINKQVATFQTLENDMLVMSADSTMRCPIAAVIRLDVHRGQKSRIGKAALIGSLVGASVGAAAGAVLAGRCEGSTSHLVGPDCGPGYIGAGAVVVGGVGALVGVGIGALSGPTHKWEEIPLNRLRVSVVPQQGGRFALGVSLRF